MRSRGTVLHVLEAVGGGTLRHLEDVTREMQEWRHVVAAPERRSAYLSADLDVLSRTAEIRVLPMKRAYSSGQNAAAVVRVARLIKELNVDLVHGHSGVGGVVATMAGALTAVPRIYTPHGLNDTRTALLAERALIRLRTRVVAVSHSEADALLQLGYPHDRVTVIPNGVEPRPSGQGGLEATPFVGSPVVAFIGRFVPEKGADVAVEALCDLAWALPEAGLYMIGAGPLEAHLHAGVARRGLADRIQWLRCDQGAERLLDHVDVLIAPSRREGGPYLPLDAMLRRVPVILTDVVGNRDLAESGARAVLVPPDDPAAVARGVLEVCSDGERRSALTARARAFVLSERSLSGVASSLDALYGSLVRAPIRQVRA